MKEIWTFGNLEIWKFGNLEIDLEIDFEKYLNTFVLIILLDGQLQQ
jgi:hypothetical protein